MSEQILEEVIPAVESAVPVTVGWWGRADSRPILLLALAFMLGYFWHYRTPQVAMVGANYFTEFIVGVWLLFVLVLTRWIQIALARTINPTFRPGFPVWPWLIAIALTTWIAVWFLFPLRVAFLISRSALDHVADRALADPGSRDQLAGRWAGLYRIEQVEVINETVVLYTDQAGGTYGFARVPRARADWITSRSAKDPRNQHQDFPKSVYPKDRFGRRIADDWFVVCSGFWQGGIIWNLPRGDR